MVGHALFFRDTPQRLLLWPAIQPSGPPLLKWSATSSIKESRQSLLQEGRAGPQRSPRLAGLSAALGKADSEPVSGSPPTLNASAQHLCHFGILATVFFPTSYGPTSNLCATATSDGEISRVFPPPRGSVCSCTTPLVTSLGANLARMAHKAKRAPPHASMYWRTSPVCIEYTQVSNGFLIRAGSGRPSPVSPVRGTTIGSPRAWHC